MKKRRLIIQNQISGQDDYIKYLSPIEYRMITAEIKYIKKIYDLFLSYSIAHQSCLELKKLLNYQTKANKFEAFRNINLRVISASACCTSYLEYLDKIDKKFNLKKIYDTDINLFILKKLRNYIVHSNVGVAKFGLESYALSSVDIKKFIVPEKSPKIFKGTFNKLIKDRKEIYINHLFGYSSNFVDDSIKKYLIYNENKIMDIYNHFLNYIDNYYQMPRSAWVNSREKGDNLCIALALLYVYMKDLPFSDKKIANLIDRINVKLRFVELMSYK